MRLKPYHHIATILSAMFCAPSHGFTWNYLNRQTSMIQSTNLIGCTCYCDVYDLGIINGQPPCELYIGQVYDYTYCQATCQAYGERVRISSGNPEISAEMCWKFVPDLDMPCRLDTDDEHATNYCNNIPCRRECFEGCCGKNCSLPKMDGG